MLVNVFSQVSSGQAIGGLVSIDSVHIGSVVDFST